jgi:predicted Zn-dependent peptidase
VSKDIGQTHLIIGVPTVGMCHADRAPLKVIERVLGMGGSARLYQRLREETNLVYTVRTVTAHYEDAGYFAVRTACDPETEAQVRDHVLDEWRRLREELVRDDELAAAKSNYAGTLARKFETNRAVAGVFGVEALFHRIEPFNQAVSRIEGVTEDDVARVARKYLVPERSVTVSVGRQ